MVHPKDKVHEYSSEVHKHEKKIIIVLKRITLVVTQETVKEFFFLALKQ